MLLVPSEPRSWSLFAIVGLGLLTRLGVSQRMTWLWLIR